MKTLAEIGHLVAASSIVICAVLWICDVVSFEAVIAALLADLAVGWICRGRR